MDCPWRGRATFAAVSFVIAFSSTIITADAAVAGPGSVLVPSIPSPIAQSNNYTVKVRSEGDKQWQSVDLYWTRVMVANVTTGAGIYHNSSVGIFDFDGVIDISIEPRRDLFPSIDRFRRFSITVCCDSVCEIDALLVSLLHSAWARPCCPHAADRCF